MSSTSTPTTFSDLYTDAGNRLRVNVSDSATLILLKRYINKGLHDLHIQQNWPWAERRGVLNTHAVYNTGTLSISTSARTTVTGSSTLWNTAVTGMGFNNARAGGKMTFSGANDVYTVSAVGGDTSITLTDSFIGSTALSGATYSYFEDEYALASDFWRMVDIRTFSADLNIPIIGRDQFYRNFARNSSPGRPTVASILELGPSTSVSGRPRVLLHPAPDVIYAIPYRYMTGNLAVSSAGTGAANLSSDTDEPIIPLRYRHVLIFYAVAQWYRDRKDDQRWESANGEYVDLVRRMAGDLSPERNFPQFRSTRRHYLAGVAGFGRQGGRFTTGTSFDELRS